MIPPNIVVTIIRKFKKNSNAKTPLQDISKAFRYFHILKTDAFYKINYTPFLHEIKGFYFFQIFL